jgi:hypothetical protein
MKSAFTDVLQDLYPDIAEIITKYVYVKCNRCHQEKESDNFRTIGTRTIKMCNDCSDLMRISKFIRNTINEEINSNGIHAPLRDGYVLKIKFKRTRCEYKFFEKTASHLLSSRYPHLNYNVSDTFEEHYVIRIVDPNHIVYRTSEFFRRNFKNMADNPQSIYTVDDMNNPIPQHIKKIKIETQMYAYIYDRLKRINYHWLMYAVEANQFGIDQSEVHRVRSIRDSNDREQKMCDLAERIQTVTMKTIQLPENCTVFQLLKIIDENWPKMNTLYEDNSHYFDRFNEDGDTYTVDWYC